MKQVIATRLVDIPDDVHFQVRARKVRVKGPRGEQHRALAASGNGNNQCCVM